MSIWLMAIIVLFFCIVLLAVATAFWEEYDSRKSLQRIRRAIREE